MVLCVCVMMGAWPWLWYLLCPAGLLARCRRHLLRVTGPQAVLPRRLLQLPQPFPQRGQLLRHGLRVPLGWAKNGLDLKAESHMSRRKAQPRSVCNTSCTTQGAATWPGGHVPDLSLGFPSGTMAGTQGSRQMRHAGGRGFTQKAPFLQFDGPGLYQAGEFRSSSEQGPAPFLRSHQPPLTSSTRSWMNRSKELEPLISLCASSSTVFACFRYSTTSSTLPSTAFARFLGKQRKQRVGMDNCMDWR